MGETGLWELFVGLWQRSQIYYKSRGAKELKTANYHVEMHFSYSSG